MNDPLIEAAPSRYRALYRRALAGELSPRQTIKCKCLECVAWHRFEDGEDRIGDCAVRGCPLWAVRPYQKARESRQASEGETSRAERATDGSEAV
jgi:hypothetical protein